MADECKSGLQVRPKHDEALTVPGARSGIIARGRQDAALLTTRHMPVAHDESGASIPEGICNKCWGDREGIPKPLVFAGCICADCSESFDQNWAGSAVTDWVLGAFPGPEPRRTERAWETRSCRFSCLVESFADDPMSRDERELFQRHIVSDDNWPQLYFYRNSVAQMKLHWAVCEPLDSLCTCIGPMTLDEVTCDYSGNRWPSCWPSGRSDWLEAVPFIRPATPEEVRTFIIVALRTALERAKKEHEGLSKQEVKPA